MRQPIRFVCLLLASIAFAAGGCVVAAEAAAVAVAPAPFIWIGPGYYGGRVLQRLSGAWILRASSASLCGSSR